MFVLNFHIENAVKIVAPLCQSDGQASKLEQIMAQKCYMHQQT